MNQETREEYAIRMCKCFDDWKSRQILEELWYSDEQIAKAQTEARQLKEEERTRQFLDGRPR